MAIAIYQETVAKIKTDPQVGYNNPKALSYLVGSREDHETLRRIFDNTFERDVERAEDQHAGGELPEGEWGEWRAEEIDAWTDALGSDWRKITVRQVRAILGVSRVD